MGTKCSKCRTSEKTSKNRSLEISNNAENSLKDSLMNLVADESLLTVEKIISKHSGNVDLLKKFASHLYEKGLLSQSSECFAQIIKQGCALDPESSLIFAHIHFTEYNYDYAMEILTDSLGRCYNDHKAHAFLSEIYSVQGSLEKSIHHITEAIGFNDKIPEYHNSLGLFLMKKKEHEQALKHFLKAYELDSSLGKALNNAGNAYRKLGKIMEAKKSYELAIDATPKRKFPIALINLATTCFHSGDIIKALQYFEEALQTGSNIHKIMVKKGYHLLFKNTKTKIAIECLYKHEFNRSIELLNEVLKTDSNNLVVHYYIAAAYNSIGKSSEANEHYKATIEQGLRSIFSEKVFVRHYIKRARKALNKVITKRLCEEIPEVDEDSENSTVNLCKIEVFKVRAESLASPYLPREPSPADSPLNTSIEEHEERCSVM